MRKDSESKSKSGKAKGGSVGKTPRAAVGKKPRFGGDGSSEKGRPVEKDRVSQQKDQADSVRPSLPIVGIGCSAGGLAALEAFLRNVPLDSGMAFVVVQHQDPTRAGMIAELLRRATSIPVSEIEDGTQVQPNHVYVIPPNKDLSILHGVLHLLPPRDRRGLRLPINSFFHSLAEDQQQKSIGVILSGMGNDGTEGLKVVKEKAGAVFVQDLAPFDAMPRSVIASGLADVVARVEELPGKIREYLDHTPAGRRTPAEPEDKAAFGINKVLILLRARTGHDFSMYKRSTIVRRIERRMGLHQVGNLADYVRFLQEQPQELDGLFKELLIGVTSFFRDPAAWDHLKQEVLPLLLKAEPSRQMLRAWVPGCSSGEEAYSLAIVFKEVLEELKPARGCTLQIFGTDLDREAIDRARAAAYPASISANVSAERLRRFFVEDESGYRVGKDVREMGIFAVQNVIMDPPFTKLDIIVCRNLLIYLNAELQNKLLPLFHYALNPGGILFLGNAETVGHASDLFIQLDGKSRIYRRLDSATSTRQVTFPASFSAAPAGTAEQRKPAASFNIQSLSDHVVLQRYAPPAVLVNSQGDILYVSGKTAKYLEIATGKANWNIFAMARSGLRFELTAAFRKAVESDASVSLQNLHVGSNGGSQVVDVTIDPVHEPEALRGTFMVVFNDVHTAPEVKPVRGKGGRVASGHAGLTQAIEELERTRHELRTTREEMQTQEEELKSANEELQSTNEELQSTNEELTTSKEELQSLNEELHTVNNELQAKLDELSRASNDMRNLLNSTEIAVVFLDNEFRVRRFTNKASTVIKLIPGDAGRPITDIAADLVYPELTDDAREVLRSLASHERRVPTRDGRWFLVRIMPYRTLDNRIDGVVITFLDVTSHRELETELKDTQDRMEEQARSQSDTGTDQRSQRLEEHGRNRPGKDAESAGNHEH